MTALRPIPLAAVIGLALHARAEVVTFDPPQYPGSIQELNGICGWRGTEGDYKVGPGLSMTGDGAMFVDRPIPTGPFMRAFRDAIVFKGTVSFDFRPGSAGHPSFWLLLKDSTPPNGTEDHAAQLLFSPSGFTAAGPQFQLRDVFGSQFGTSPLTGELVAGGDDWYRITFTFDFTERISNPNGTFTTRIIHMNNGALVWDVQSRPIGEAVDSIDLFYINAGVQNGTEESRIDNIDFSPEPMEIPPPVPPAQFELIELGTLGGVGSTAEGINNAGQVCGQSSTDGAIDGSLHAFFFDSAVPGAMLQDIGHILPTQFGPSYGFAINELGHIVGRSDREIAYLWNGTGMINLGTITGINSAHAEAHGVNDFDHAVGWGSVGGGDMHGWVWDSVQGMRDLGALGTQDSFAYDINNAGLAIGWSQIPGNHHAFIVDTTATPLTMLDIGETGVTSRAYAVNNLGQVVGEFYGFGRRAFLYDTRDPDPEFLNLGHVGSTSCSPGCPESAARDINDHGWVVGESIPGGSSQEHAFLWDGNEMHDLNDLIPAGTGWFLEYAQGINNEGMIVGLGDSPGGETEAYLLVPVEDPDFDEDGVVNVDDNCPLHPNPNQDDVDDDGIGDVCDTDVAWVPGGSGTWEDVGNWTAGAVPGPEHDVVIATQSNLTIQATQAPFVGSLSLGGGTGQTTVALPAGTPLSTESNLTIGANATLQGGANVGGSFFQTGSGTLTLRIAGTAINDVERIDVWESAFLAGHLEIQFLDGFVPEVGHTFDLITTCSGTVQGSFSLLTTPDIYGISFELIYLEKSVQLLASQSAMAIQSFGISDAVVLSFASKPGFTYQLEFADGPLDSFTWSGLAQEGNGQSLNLYDSMPSSAGRVYRIREFDE
jgi:probable HAF family extracellular repeat protein